MASRRQKAVRAALEDAVLYGTGVVKVTPETVEHAPHADLRDGLRNIKRSSAKALDAAGVPEDYQGAGMERYGLGDWGDDE